MLLPAKKIVINDVVIGNSRVYIIAEMACAHDGDMDRARELIDSAVRAGVDAVQLQLFSVENLIVPNHHLYDLLVKIEFSHEQWKELFSYARKYDIAIFACTYDMPSATLALEYGADGIKLNSSDLSNPEIIRLIAGSGIPFTLGTGASTLKEIAYAIDISLKAGGDKLILMHGVQNFPTDIKDANIKRIQLLKKSFNAIIGYQDHTDASLPFSKVVDLLAVGSGADVIEKHITLSRAEKGTDYQAALEPAEMKQFVESIRTATAALGSDTIQPLTESEMKYREFQKKSIVANSDIKKGQIVEKKMLAFMRTTLLGLDPTRIDTVIGKTAIRDINRFENISMSDLN